MRKKTIAFSKRAIKAATPAWLNWTLAVILIVAYVVKLTVAQDSAISDHVSERILFTSFGISVKLKRSPLNSFCTYGDDLVFTASASFL